MSTNRMESFSDGVIAVAITLLVLNITVPSPKHGHSLAAELLSRWPVYAAYVTSFITIGIVWINHHAAIGRLASADHAILLINLLLLLCIGVIPFATSLIAAYLKRGQGENLAAGVYAGAFLLMSMAFVWLNWHILFRKAHMLGERLSRARRRQILARGVTGIAPYAVATAIAAVSPYATLAICAAVAAFYATPLATGGAPGDEPGGE